MKIIYHCFGGSHSSVTAAGIHLGMLPLNRLPLAQEIEKLPFFDAQDAADHGILRFFGNDNYNNQIYIVGRRNLEPYYESLMLGILQIAKIDCSEVLFVNTMPCVNIAMKIGGFASRKMGIVFPGRNLVIAGIRAAYPKYVRLVNAVKWGKNISPGVETSANHL